MNILLAINTITFGGSERVMVNLANYLCNEHNVTLVGLSKSKHEKVYDIDERVNYINGIENGNHQVKGILSFRKVVKKIKPDVILSFITQINIAVIIATRGLGIPVIVSERCDPVSAPTQKSRRILRERIYPFATVYVFQTEMARDFFAPSIRKKGVVIPNPMFIDIEHVPFDKRRKEIVSAARMMPKKRQDMIIEAFDRVADEFSEYTLHFYGDGDTMNDMKALASEKKCKDRIVFHGSVSGVLEKEKDSEVFILASDHEGMPNALMEAMGLGLACISTDCPCGGPAFLIEHGVNGELIPVNDTDALEKSLRKVLSDDEYRKKIADNAVALRQTLGQTQIFKKWEDYLKLCAKH